MSLIDGPPETTLELSSQRRPTRFRWTICALLFFATTVNYVDRSVLAVLSPTLQTKIGWSDTQYGNINAFFAGAYAVGMLVAGRMIDVFGVRFGYTFALICWSLCSIGHAFVKTVTGFTVARVCLGVFESANFPAAVKATAEWFPNKERSFAIGLFNSGSNVGAILAPLLVPVIAIRFGWQSAFIVTGAAGLLWVIFWLPIYRRPQEHPRVSPEELSYIVNDPHESVVAVKWTALFPYPQTWAFSIAKFLTDAVWWFWLFWAAPFFHDRFGADLKHIGIPLVIIYNMASFGSIGGGWIPTGFARMGFTTNFSRKMAMLICALCVLPVVVTPQIHREWIAIILIGVAAAAHQGFSANLFALSGDLFPKRAVGSVVGLGGFCGAVGGMLFQFFSGRIVDPKGPIGSYIPLFIFCATAYLVSILIIQILSPRLEPAKFDDDATPANAS